MVSVPIIVVSRSHLSRVHRPLRWVTGPGAMKRPDPGQIRAGSACTRRPAHVGRRSGDASPQVGELVQWRAILLPAAGSVPTVPVGPIPPGRVALFSARRRDGAARSAQHGGVPPRSPYDNLVHPRTVKKPAPQIAAERDLVVEDPSSGFVGAVVRCEKDVVHLEDRFGKVRAYPLGPGFWVDGRPVVLV